MSHIHYKLIREEDDKLMRLALIPNPFFYFMAIFRKVHVTFWRDEFVESLTPEQKFFYIYLLTNDRTTQCGIYEITNKQMCYDTGYNEDTIKKLIEFFVSSGKIKYSKDTKEIALKNWVKYNDSNSPKVKACIDKELLKVKNRVLIQYLYSMDTHTQEEQEEEQEQEKEQEEGVFSDLVISNHEFEDWWESYDKKADKVKSIKLWNKLKKEEKLLALSKVLEYVESTPDKNFRKNPSTYLFNKSFNDEIIIRTNNNDSKPNSAERRFNAIASLRYIGDGE